MNRPPLTVARATANPSRVNILVPCTFPWAFSLGFI